MSNAFEKHYTPQELGRIWCRSAKTIQRWFIDESGVLLHGKENRRDGKRDHVMLIIPASVAERVYKSRLRRPMDQGISGHVGTILN